jgi:hypothetical protein
VVLPNGAASGFYEDAAECFGLGPFARDFYDLCGNSLVSRRFCASGAMNSVVGCNGFCYIQQRDYESHFVLLRSSAGSFRLRARSKPDSTRTYSCQESATRCAGIGCEGSEYSS